MSRALHDLDEPQTSEFSQITFLGQCGIDNCPSRLLKSSWVTMAINTKLSSKVVSWKLTFKQFTYANYKLQ